MLTGNVLEDEKILGTVHVAFGASAGIGGTVSVPIHLDVVILEASLEIDGQAGARPRTLCARLNDARDAARGPERLRGPATRPRSDASPARSTGACSTSTPTPTTTAACSRSRASPGSLAQAGRRRRRARRSDGSISTTTTGIHPRVGRDRRRADRLADPEDRGAACAEALVLGDLLGEELELPVFLYGELAQGRTRAELRNGGPASSRNGFKTESCAPTSARRRLHPTAGAVLVAARPPLVAFNVELAPPATLDDARAIAARIRGGAARKGSSRSGRSACGWRRAASPRSRPTSRTTARRRSPASSRRSRRHATPSRAELVGLAPRAAFDGFPADLGREPPDRRGRARRGRAPGVARPCLRALSCIDHGPDQAQAPHEAPRDGGRNDPDAGSDRSPADGRREEEAVPDGRAPEAAEHAADLEGLDHPGSGSLRC